MEFFGVDWTTAGRVLAGAVPVAVTVAGLTRGPGAMRSRLKHDVELLEKLPDGTAAREKYEAYLAIQVDRLAKLETESSRDYSNLITGGLVVVIFGGAAMLLFSLNDWWWWIAAVGPLVMAAVGLSMMFDAAQRVPRDEKNKPI